MTATSRNVILKNKDNEYLIPFTDLATASTPGRVKPDGTSLTVNSTGTLSVTGKQDTLVSGTNIKTVGGASLLGSGNIALPTKTSDLTNDSGFITSSALSGYQTTANLVTSVSSSSTDSQYPSAKLFYDTVGDIESALNTINSGGVTMCDLTFEVSGTPSYFENLTVNNTSYTLNDFTTVTANYVYNLTLQFASGTSITWSATPTSRIDVNQGTFTLSTDTTISIYVAGGKG